MLPFLASMLLAFSPCCHHSRAYWTTHAALSSPLFQSISSSLTVVTHPLQCQLRYTWCQPICKSMLPNAIFSLYYFLKSQNRNDSTTNTGLFIKIPFSVHTLHATFLTFSPKICDFPCDLRKKKTFIGKHEVGFASPQDGTAQYRLATLEASILFLHSTL